MESELKSNHDKVILYIDDNASNIILVKKIIEGVTSYSFISATDAITGLALAEEQLPNLILMDINMPGMDGFSALGELQNNKATQHIPVVAVSGNATNEDIAKGQSAGFHSYIAKPFKVKMMVDIFDEILS